MGMMTLQCEHCGSEQEPTGDGGSFVCRVCLQLNHIPTETCAIEIKLEETQPAAAQVLEKGTLVKLDNQDHVWHGEFALICGHKHGFYRLELLGKRLWVPREWVKYEPNESDN